jgi:hypothetical protein
MTAVQAELVRLAPAGTAIFATGWGAGWYLLADRANPTTFDVVLAGLGTSSAQSLRLQETLLREPPPAVIVPVEQWWPAPPGTRRSRDLDAAAVRAGVAPWWDRLEAAYVEEPLPGASAWVVLRRR